MSAYQVLNTGWIIISTSDMDTTRLHQNEQKIASEAAHSMTQNRTRLLYISGRQTKLSHKIRNHILSSLLKPLNQRGFSYMTLINNPYCLALSPQGILQP